MAALRSTVARILAAGLATAVVLYAALYWRSELGAGGDSDADDTAALAALLGSSKDYQSQLAKKDAQIFNVSKMLWDLVERYPILSNGSDIDFLIASNLTGFSSPISRSRGSSDGSHGRNLGLRGMLLNLDGNSIRLQPRMTLGYKKHQALLVLGISHVRRPKGSYLMTTLQSLVNGMTQQDTTKTVIIVQVSEPWNVSYYLDVCKQVRSQFASHVTSGLIEIILPPEHFYPDLDLLVHTKDNTAQETRWHVKQSLDYVFLMGYSIRRCKYYVQLEDDVVVSSPNYVATMLAYVAKLENGWLMVDFTSLGLIGKLFHSETLAVLVQFLVLFCEHKPLDVLLFNYFYVRECFSSVLLGEAPVSETNCPDMARVVRTLHPALFQHIGADSSLDGNPSNNQFDPVQQKSPTAPEVISHSNPPASVTTSLKQYQDFSVTNCYSGLSVFWALNPQPDDFILISFVTPANIKRYRLLTGDQQHTSDKALDATIEVLPSSREPFSGQNQTTISEYRVLCKFNESAAIGGTVFSLADGAVPSEMSPVSALKVTFHAASQNWLLLKEVHIELN